LGESETAISISCPDKNFVELYAPAPMHHMACHVIRCHAKLLWRIGGVEKKAEKFLVVTELCGQLYTQLVGLQP
jgi:hypothetical protein